LSDVAADTRLIPDYPALSESLWRRGFATVRNMESDGAISCSGTRVAYFRGGEPFA
jgi:xanthine dehydrogenase YagS FAD-binding subunit